MKIKGLLEFMKKGSSQVFGLVWTSMILLYTSKMSLRLTQCLSAQSLESLLLFIDPFQTMELFTTMS